MNEKTELEGKDKGTVRDIERSRGKTDGWKESEIEADTSQGQRETDVSR